jgi:hypothetical protein
MCVFGFFSQVDLELANHRLSSCKQDYESKCSDYSSLEKKYQELASVYEKKYAEVRAAHKVRKQMLGIFSLLVYVYVCVCMWGWQMH